MSGGEIVRFKDGAMVVRFARRPGGVEVLMGERVMEGTSPHTLRAKLRKEVLAGRIESAGPVVRDVYGAWTVVRPLEAPARKLRYALIIGTTLGVVAGLGSMIWYNRMAALVAALTVIALVTAMRYGTRFLARRHNCPGLHCPGPH